MFKSVNMKWYSQNRKSLKIFDLFYSMKTVSTWNLGEKEQARADQITRYCISSNIVSPRDGGGVGRSRDRIWVRSKKFGSHVEDSLHERSPNLLTLLRCVEKFNLQVYARPFHLNVWIFFHWKVSKDRLHFLKSTSWTSQSCVCSWE